MTADEAKARMLALEVYAWTAEDQLGFKVRLKPGKVPDGMTALVAVNRRDIDTPALVDALREQSQRHGNRIYLLRFRAIEIIKVIEQ